MQLWDTRTDLEQFNEAVFLPAMARPGPQGPRPPIVHDVDTVLAWVAGEKLQ